MKNNKICMKIMTLTIVIAMILTITANAVTFTDISNHWAKDYIQKVANNGLVTGYDNGTFRPEANVTILEALIMMSRLYKIDDDIKEQILDKYKSVLKNMPNAADYEWAYEGLSIALELGIVSENGLKSMFAEKTISKNASKEEISVLMTKAMLLEEETKYLKSYVLPFADAAQINDKAKPYIYIMYKKGIVTGDDKKNINPNANISRAVMATMMDRTYDYIQENKIVPTLENYKPTKSLNGIITDVTEGDIESYLYIKDSNEETTIVRINESTKLRINNKSAKISEIKKDMLVTCKIDEQRIAKSLDVDNLTKIIKGTIYYVAYSSPAKITIINEDKKKIEYSVPSENMKIYLDGKETELRNLVKEDLVTLRVKENVLYQIDSTSRIQKYKGKITAIDYTNLPIKLTIKTEKNAKPMIFEYSNDVEVMRNKESSSFDQIRVGDDVTLTAEYDKMIKIDSSAAEAQMKGIIKEILVGSNVKIKIADVDGNVKEYTVSNNVKINLGSKNATIYDLRVGYQIGINMSGDEIVTIEAAEIQAARNFSGKVILVNIDDRLLTMQNINMSGQTELVYVRVANSTRIFNISGETKYLKDIEEGKNIMCTVISQGVENVAVSIMIQ